MRPAFAHQRTLRGSGRFSGGFATARTNYDDLLIQEAGEFSFQRPDRSASCMTPNVNSSRDKVGGL